LEALLLPPLLLINTLRPPKQITGLLFVAVLWLNDKESAAVKSVDGDTVSSNDFTLRILTLPPPPPG